MKRSIVAVAAGTSLGVALALRSTLRIPVFEGASDDIEPWLVASLPEPLASVVFIAIGGVLGALAARSGRSILAPFLLAGLAAAVYVPGAFAVAPFLAAFSGRFLDFVLVGAAMMVSWRFFESRSPELRFWTANRIALVGFLVCLAIGFKMSQTVGLSGDEPHYLLITESLVRDGDLRVQNNYFQEDYLRFYQGKIGPHLASGTPYSVHGIGVALLLLPGYAVAGLSGVVVTLALLGAILWRGLYQAAWLLTESRAASILAACAFGLSSPALFLTASAYPELPGAVIVVLVFVRMLQPPSERNALLLGWGLAVGTLPFFHVKFIPLALVLWTALAFRCRRGRGLLLVGAAVSALALVTFFYITTGSFDPTASYGRQRVFFSAIPLGLLGLLFDQEFGLLPVAPFYLIGIAGLVAAARRHLFFGVTIVLVLAAVGLPGAAHPLWSGGNSVPARFLFPGLPLLALAAACLWVWERRQGVTPWLPSLLILSLCVSGFTAFLPGQPLYLNARDGTGRFWEVLSSSWDLTSYLPSVVNADVRSLALASLGFVVVLLCLVAQYRRRALWLPPIALVLLACAWAQDLTGVAHPRAQDGRWVSGFLRELADKRPTRFLALPEHGILNLQDVKTRVPLRLRAQRPDGDPRHWWSLPYAIPAGRYRVAGVRMHGWAPCNGDSCFEVEGPRFETKLALARFRARARRLENAPPRIYLEELADTEHVAAQSLAFEGRRRLHSLDDNAYLDRRGFWVKRRAKAIFALESTGASELEISNGGSANWITLETTSSAQRFLLAPWEKKRFTVSLDDGLAVLAIRSEGGFRPSELDPGASDHRELGVLVSAPRL